MSISVSQRMPREWLHLILAMLAVGGIGFVWHTYSGGFTEEEWSKWTPERLRRLLLGPEQIGCYFCCIWAGLILLSRYREVVRQRQAFYLDLLPLDEATRILPEDARPYARKIDQASQRGGPFILTTMLRQALTKYAITRSAADVSEVVRTQAEVEQGRMTTSMGTVNYLVWAIPAIGFLGTVRGLAGGMSMAGVDEDNLQRFLKAATDQLGTAFDCTFVALFLSVVLMYLLLSVQKGEEMLIIDAQSYCQDQLLLRLYDPNPETQSA
ncbi:MotA/TolQ/ExbB proton channel family protein [Tuwongella immobilis]|uniref:Membrane protein: Putative biopolymer transport protein, ExbB family n=1 Tax=Tuwongella immobilis TaxID=692036 RepID=A0A6C2YSF0_9BACT|nr:MotA/TolQ/ExbB proton channel family protein [Tuwongella immobilis]VIP04063.1 membrane protein : Putative biopolymer transport protein, ExbB family OS=Haliea rubra DSM 19751 GN=HRUBRA_00927 PE=4 SV=1 [Tuwongella immobilis]VTS05493.1 membrane protein : Putative biopolymer transport protein, ExbB family OS=Haliea rubra DSM 19751 GN=HRUBRA_00927 PE=4 SV=1 [Tuwongella immobilis]